METALRPGRPSGHEMDGYRWVIDRVRANPDCWGRWYRLATLALPDEYGLAVAVRDRLKHAYGPAERMSGLRYWLVPDLSGQEEYLAVRYQPDVIEPGYLEAWRERRRVRL